MTLSLEHALFRGGVGPREGSSITKTAIIAVQASSVKIELGQPRVGESLLASQA